MRRFLVVAVLVLGACGGGDDKATAPTTTARPACLRVSQVFMANLRMSPPSALSAVAAPNNGHQWYVGSADGAVWSTTGDPTAGVPDPDGLIAPLNSEALEVSILGSANGIGGEHALGALATDTEAKAAIACARRAESAGG